MPEMNGLDALKEIMIQCPVPVVMLSSTTQRGTENAIAAIEGGQSILLPSRAGPFPLIYIKFKMNLCTKWNKLQRCQFPN